MGKGEIVLEDSQIVELYWQKNADAISETANKYGPYCFTIADNILHCAEDSEECVNDTWLHTWNAIPPQKPNVFRMFFAKTSGVAVKLFLFWTNWENVLLAGRMLRLRMRLRNWNSVFAALFGHSRNGTEMYLCAAISLPSQYPQLQNGMV